MFYLLGLYSNIILKHQPPIKQKSCLTEVKLGKERKGLHSHLLLTVKKQTAKPQTGGNGTKDTFDKVLLSKYIQGTLKIQSLRKQVTQMKMSTKPYLILYQRRYMANRHIKMLHLAFH